MDIEGAGLFRGIRSLKKKTESTALTDAIVVDDDPVYLSFWRRILTDMGVIHFKLIDDPVIAADMIKNFPCALLISDLIMPGISGFDLAGIALGACEQCRIILTTAYRTELSRFHLPHKKFHILYKPYSNLEELKKLLVHLIEDDPNYEDMNEDSFTENKDFPEILEWKF